jgi:hypothetical protein
MNDESQNPNNPGGPIITPPAPPPSEGLTTTDWVICVLCSGIGCIIGIIRLIQGKPNAGKMIGISILFAVIWSIVRFILEAVTSHN